MAADFPRKRVRSLQSLCQIEVIKSLHSKASDLHRDYFKTFASHLTPYQQKVEPKEDVRPETLNPYQVVNEFESKIRAKEAAANEAKMKGKVKKVGQSLSSARRDGLGSSTLRLRPYDSTSAPKEAKKKTTITSSPFSYLDFGELLIMNLPPGFSPLEFIKYRKCKLLRDINVVRQYLESHLNCQVSNSLMSMMENIMMSSTSISRPQSSRGLSANNQDCITNLILQSLFMNIHCCQVNLKPLKLWTNLSFFKLSGSILNASFLNESEVPSLETRAESMILHYGFLNCDKLTHLQLNGAACDRFLQVISDHCAHLQYLDISDSAHVTDQGFYYLAGVTEEETRGSKYARACKKVPDANVSKQNANLTKTKPGCLKLTHLIAYGLKRMSWNQNGSHGHSLDFINMLSNNNHGQTSKCPRDSGFVMVLKHLPNLRVFLTEKGGKIMETLLAEKKRLKCPTLSSLEVMADHQVNKGVMKSILNLCPNLKSINVRADQRGKDESWMEALSSGHHQIESITVTESTFKGPNLCQIILEPVNGAKLTCLDVRELCYFRMSWLQKLKLNCQNLQKLVIGINTRMTIHTLHLHQIDIINDFNLGNGDGKEDPDLKNLELFHLHGPFGPEVTSYLLKGAEKLTNLALLIEWMDANFLSVQPNDKDYLGVEYLKELLKVNSFSKISQLHLAGGTRRRYRAKLDKNCASFVLEKFGQSLLHLGSFDQWNILKTERSKLVDEFTAQNRRILLEEHLKPKGTIEKVDFSKKYVENRLGLSCQDPYSLLSTQFDERHNDFLDLFEVIAGLQGFFEGNEEPEDSDSDDSIMESDDGFLDEAVNQWNDEDDPLLL